MLVVEPDEQRRAAAQARIQKLLPRQASKLEWIAGATAADLKGAHVVLSCAPYSANLELTRLALEAGVAFTDLGGNPRTVAAQEKLAGKKRVPVVPDCGISPGISNIFAMHCARAHGCTRIEVRCGGLPLGEPERTANPLGYKLVFSASGLDQRVLGLRARDPRGQGAQDRGALADRGVRRAARGLPHLEQLAAGRAPARRRGRRALRLHDAALQGPLAARARLEVARLPEGRRCA